jgi:phage host-nuclease inhibitor protein Gam
MIYTFLRRQLGINDLEIKITNLHDQRFQLQKLLEELVEQVAAAQRDSAARAKTMRDELMESEARLMTRVEELESIEPTEKADTLTGESQTGYISWSERKRIAAQREQNPTALRNKLNGNLPSTGRPAQDDFRRGHDVPSNGEAPSHEGN